MHGLLYDNGVEMLRLVVDAGEKMRMRMRELHVHNIMLCQMLDDMIVCGLIINTLLQGSDAVLSSPPVFFVLIPSVSLSSFIVCLNAGADLMFLAYPFLTPPKVYIRYFTVLSLIFVKKVAI
jgi:hypothetical protein